jgi:hypothetical protein
VSFQSVVSRVSEIRAMQQLLLGPTAPAAQAAGSASSPSFSDVLGTKVANAATPAVASPSTASTASTATAPVAPAAPAVDPDPGAKALQFAQGEIGQAEQPPGSNDSARIAVYRGAVQGAVTGQPWCAYFVSWAAQQAGTPLGEAGQGFGSVGAVSAWAQRTGRWNPAGSGTPPQPGDLIAWGGEHIGIVESVDPDGTLHTIEGNSSNAVTRRTHGADGDGATGFVRLG